MRILILLIFITLFTEEIFCQSGEWTWMHGSKRINSQPNYGIRGTASSSNDPGSRHGSVGWKDVSGSLWLFGGENASSSTVWYNDIWKYNPVSNQWTWINGDNFGGKTRGVYNTKGIASPSNQPGSRKDAVQWTDLEGNFWLFGGFGVGKHIENPTTAGEGFLNDLWKYSQSTNEWTWMNGSDIPDQLGQYGTKGVSAGTNNPRARLGATTWTDGLGNLWLFGGMAYSTAYSTCSCLAQLNDLWKYSPLSDEWTWVSGDSLENIGGQYNIQGSASASNKPGARNKGFGWQVSGELFMYGGGGYSDVWKYNVTSNLWTWVKGDSTYFPGAIYGTHGLSSSVNKPGGRVNFTAAADAGGKLWMYAGKGVDVDGTNHDLTDLWVYSPANNEWVWMSGDNQVTFEPVFEGSYGTREVSSPSNRPGLRNLGNAWFDNVGRFWLFGGWAFFNTSRQEFGSLWRYVPDNIVLPVALHVFSAQKNLQSVKLVWKTGNEQGVARFDIEKSTDATTFLKFSEVKATNTNSYSFYDFKSAEGKIYYRLKTIDKDEKYVYSTIVSIQRSSKEDFVLYPNPARNEVVLYTGNVKGQIQIEIIDMGGRRISESTFMVVENQIKFLTEKLVSGTYWMKITTKNEKVVKRLVVSK